MGNNVNKIQPAGRGEADPTQRIRQAILEGQLFPNERLVELDLAKRFMANRGSVRLALAVLEQQGLVVRELNRGARVRAVTEKEAIEIMETRAVLESLTARHAAANAKKNDIAALKVIMRELETLSANGDLFGYSSRNVDFHQMIARLANHSTAEKILAELSSQTVALQFRPIFEPNRAKQINEEHRALFDAIAANNPTAAEKAMRRHLDNSVVALKAAISKHRYVQRPQIAPTVVN